MVATILIIGLAFLWLGYETDWMRVRLLIGAYLRDEQSGRKWQFSKYGDDALMLCQQCHNVCPNHRHYSENRWFGWAIPARTVKAFGSTMNFNEGCNYQRARLLKDIAKEHKRKAPVSYKPETKYMAQYYNCYDKESIDILVDGKPELSVDGNYKRGMIKDFMRQYCKPSSRLVH